MDWKVDSFTNVGYLTLLGYALLRSNYPIVATILIVIILLFAVIILYWS